MRPSLSVFAAAAVFLAFCGLLSEGFKVGAFNIQTFGVKKLNDEAVMTPLVAIVQRYDLVFIQEVRDRTGEVLPAFLDAVNSGSEYEYDMVVSPRLGTTSSKEQYAYMYRKTTVAILHHPFVSRQDFERPPYCVQVMPRDNRLPPFIAIGVHVKPTAARAEIDRLPAVYEEAVAHFKRRFDQNADQYFNCRPRKANLYAPMRDCQADEQQDVLELGVDQDPLGLDSRNPHLALLLGDFNADGAYLSENEYQNLKLTRDGRFRSLSIGEKTNVKNTFSYDRFFAAGGLEKYLRSKPTVFRFDKAYNLSPAQTKAVSDHYPIELELQPLPTENIEIVEAEPRKTETTKTRSRKTDRETMEMEPHTETAKYSVYTTENSVYRTKNSGTKRTRTKKAATEKRATKKAATKKAATKKAAAKKTATNKAATKKAATKKAAAKKTATKKAAAKKTATKKAAAKKTATKKTSTKKAATKKTAQHAYESTKTGARKTGTNYKKTGTKKTGAKTTGAKRTRSGKRY